MIDTEATERFMAAPWLAEVDRDTKRAILARWSKRGPRAAQLCSRRVSPTIISRS